jgi:hypothetical protein
MLYLRSSRQQRRPAGLGEEQARRRSGHDCSQHVVHSLPHPIPRPAPPCPAGMPPVVFIAMDRDPSMAARISGDARHLRDMGVPTVTVRVAPRVVYPTFFSDRRWGSVLCWQGCVWRGAALPPPAVPAMAMTGPIPTALASSNIDIVSSYPQSPSPGLTCSPRVSPEVSASVVAALRQIGMLDAAGYVTMDPR